MAASIIGTHCDAGWHDRCSGGRTTPGVLGGWKCSCACHRPPRPCPTPENHETHAYCPSCGWRQETLRERMERHGPLVYTKNMGADEPVFHRLLENDEGDVFPVCDAGQPSRNYWGSLHVKHASRIGAACDVCFPT